MSNSNTLSAKDRIESLVDENSFVELGAGITKRAQISTWRRNLYRQMVSSPDMD